MGNITKLDTPAEEIDEEDYYLMKSYELPSNFHEVETFTLEMTRISDKKLRYIAKQTGRQPRLYPVKILEIIIHNKKVKLMTVETVGDAGKTLPHTFKALKLHETIYMGDPLTVYMPVKPFVFRGVIYNLFEVIKMKPAPNIVQATTMPGMNMKGN